MSTPTTIDNTLHRNNNLVQHMKQLEQHRHRARLYLLSIFIVWFLCIAIGALAYEGEPILVKSKDLPLYLFDRVFRTLGSGLIFILWTVRTALSHGLQLPRHHKPLHLWIPGLIYAAQAAFRALVYKLHLDGIIFTRHTSLWTSLSSLLTKRHQHPEHVMSDHILLASSIVAACACEAIITTLSLRYISKASSTSRQGHGVLKVYALVAAGVGMLVSVGSFYTSRYFHPPSEIMTGAILGLVLFQIPLIMFIRRVNRRHEEEEHVD